MKYIKEYKIFESVSDPSEVKETINIMEEMLSDLVDDKNLDIFVGSYEDNLTSDSDDKTTVYVFTIEKETDIFGEYISFLKEDFIDDIKSFIERTDLNLFQFWISHSKDISIKSDEWSNSLEELYSKDPDPLNYIRLEFCKENIRDIHFRNLK